jgi:hypothetical protein
MKKITLRKNQAVVAFWREYFQPTIKPISIQIRFKTQYLSLIKADIICIQLFTLII